MAGRKVFTSGEILTAADVNSYLMNQVVAVFADSTARSSAIPTPSEGMVTYREDANRVEVFDGSAFGAIGGILQVVSTTFSTETTTTSSSFQDTGLSLSITPSSASVKILVLVNQNGLEKSNVDTKMEVRLLRDATDLGSFAGPGTLNTSTANRTNIGGTGFSKLDEPNTTSSVTYKTQFRRDGSSATVTVQDNSAVSSITLMEVAV